MRKGQITLFIIIGLIILLTAAFVFYLVYLKEKPVEREAITPPLPIAEADPVSALVMTCLKTTAQNGLKIIGDHGGYLKPQFTLNPYEPTEAEAVQLGKTGGLIIPYWWHMTSPNTCKGGCEFDSQRPEFYEFEDLLKEYIQENILECLNNFEAVRRLGYEIETKSQPEAEVKIRAKDILLMLDWEITVSKADTLYDLEEFSAKVDLDIKEIYDTATEITNKEIEYTFLENAVKELIYAFADMDKDALPPISQMTFTTGETYWLKSDIQTKIKQLLQSYIPILQTSDTRNYNYVAAPGRTRDTEMYELLYNRQFLVPLDEPHPDLEVRFFYFDWWKPYLDLNCKGELCQPDTSLLEHMLFFLPINKYSFVYDVSIPVMVEISKPSAFNGEGYSFKFFLEANLRNNNAFTSDTILAESLERKDLGMFCKPNQRTSGEVRIDLTDYASGETIEGASITYTCGDVTCAIGTTTKEIFASKFPRCLNGIITINKQGYSNLYLPLTLADAELDLKAKMFPEKQLKINARKYKIVKERDWDLDTSKFYPVDAQEDLMITLTKEPRAFEDTYSTLADLSGGQEAVINLLPGKYKMNIIGFLKEKMVLPKDKRCPAPTRFLGIEFYTPDCYYVPQYDMVFDEQNPFPSTVLNLEFEIKPDKLYQSNELLLNYFSLAFDKVPQANRKIEDMNQISKMQSYALLKEPIIRPILR